MPFDRPWQDSRFFRKLLGVVLAEVNMLGGFLMEGKDIVRGLQLRDGNETDLHVYYQRLGSLGVHNRSLWDVPGVIWRLRRSSAEHCRHSLPAPGRAGGLRAWSLRSPDFAPTLLALTRAEKVRKTGAMV